MRGWIAVIKLYPSFNNMVTKFNGVIEKHANIGNYPLVNKLTEYLFANSALASSNVIYTSYNEIKNLGKVMPLDYINSFISSQTSKSQRHKLLLRNNHIKEYDVLPWTKCFSLLNTGEKIYLPIQMLFTDYIHKNNKEEQYRGIASHSSYFKAMEKAILDNINVDAFTLTCFTNQKYKKVIFDNDRVLNILRKHKLLGDECDYEITPLYITQPDLQVPNFAVILKRKKQKSPYLLMSIEADLDPLEALLHGISDSISRAKSILKNTMFSSLYNNSLYWVMPHDIILKNKSVSERSGRNCRKIVDCFHTITGSGKYA